MLSQIRPTIGLLLAATVCFTLLDLGNTVCESCTCFITICSCTNISWYNSYGSCSSTNSCKTKCLEAANLTSTTTSTVTTTRTSTTTSSTTKTSSTTRTSTSTTKTSSTTRTTTTTLRTTTSSSTTRTTTNVRTTTNSEIIVPFNFSNSSTIQTLNDLFNYDSEVDLSELSDTVVLSLLGSGIDSSDCLVNCSNKGACSVQGFNLICKCLDGYAGSSCNINLDPCSSYPCLNNGTCLPGLSNDSYTCQCDDLLYYGTNCENRVDLCQNVTCSGNGDCVIQGRGTKCKCYYLYTGESCEIKSSEKQKIDTVVSVTSLIAIATISSFYVLVSGMDCIRFYQWFIGSSEVKKKKKPIKISYAQ